jgi:hypothetical protein
MMNFWKPINKIIYGMMNIRKPIIKLFIAALTFGKGL